MADWLARAAATRPGHPAVVADDATLTFAQLDAQATGLAGRLAGAGARPGRPVGLLAPASAAHVAALLAVARLGAVAVPLDPRLPAPALRARLGHTGTGLVVAGAGSAAVAEEAGSEVLRLDQAGGPAAAFQPAPWDGLQGLVFTSGTSGRPRAAMLTFANHAASAAASAFNLGIAPEDRWLACVSLHHVGGLAVVFRSCLAASTMVLQERFDARRANEAIDAGAALASMVPVMLQRVLDDRGSRPFPPSLRGILLGGDAAPRALLRACKAARVPVLPTYGLTEAASQVASASPLDPRQPEGAAGRPLPLADVRIEAEDGTPLAPAETGEIIVRGPMVMAGYWREAEATAQALRGGALHTGDLGFLDKDGYLWVTGRASDRVVTGGEKVDPAEVEAVLETHPAVVEACVVGTPHPSWGEQVTAAVVLRAGAKAGPAELEAHCRKALPGFKVPRRWVLVPPLPRTAAGKLQRGLVREALRGETPES
jgi:O-succinylbenzoic acid--CoA ligase